MGVLTSISEQEVPSANLMLHQAHCARNFVRCQLCNSPVPNIEKHMATRAAPPLMFEACESLNVEVLQDCLLHGADSNAANDSGVTPLHMAARMDSIKIVQLLVDAKGSLQPNSMHDTPLDVAFKTGASAAVIELLQKIQPALVPHTPPRVSQAPKRRSLASRRPLGRITLDCQLPGMAPSIRAAAPTTTSQASRANTARSCTPAADPTHAQFARCSNCLEKVPSQNIALHQVHCERTKRRCEQCNLVLPPEETEEHCTYFSDSECMLAMVDELSEQREELCNNLRKFIQHGVDLNRAGNMGETAMHRAVRLGFVSMVEMLLEAGASLRVTNCMHDSPVQIAQRLVTKGEAHKDVYNLLTSKS
eukprot:TRINITY_DN4488_c0_g1_i1.p1 TRINITY_DN4488_c0_g1~~TRINITY_DN4488_c0_g1_i1.p1  ORF type:complete len:363 (-),score=61.86 TRINITY_DN4488_c0_g1_i1:66-1154(-)